MAHLVKQSAKRGNTDREKMLRMAETVRAIRVNENTSDTLSDNLPKKKHSQE